MIGSVFCPHGTLTFLESESLFHRLSLFPHGDIQVMHFLVTAVNLVWHSQHQKRWPALSILMLGMSTVIIWLGRCLHCEDN